MAEFSDLPDRELLERIYAAQLRIQMDIEVVRRNIIDLRKKIEPEAFSMEKIGKGENPHHWRHLDDIHKDFDDAYTVFKQQFRSLE